MATCFVMQSFDRAVFDQRYDDVFAPAIRDAGLDPYRVDRDPTVSIPIQEIEAGIREARLCLAEITQDNPNVWFELGYAIACKKEVVLLCSKERTTKFPFDIQHRTIIHYPTGSLSDFTKLKSDITAKVRAYLDKIETLSAASEISRIAPVEGLEQHEVVCIASIAENIDHPTDHASTFIIKRDMETSGFTKTASTIALASLLKKGLVEGGTYADSNIHESYIAYNLTDTGWQWVLDNKEKFVLRKPKPVDSEDIPF